MWPASTIAVCSTSLLSYGAAVALSTLICFLDAAVEQQANISVFRRCCTDVPSLDVDLRSIESSQFMVGQRHHGDSRCIPLIKRSLFGHLVNEPLTPAHSRML
ncbi:hypothetical protein DL98DRAFT_285049 [Cadophora sp. DSE1049]|nr:hypothetical protein DL98DRAFT_285049 [Cadophora sp. DSE1049]